MSRINRSLTPSILIQLVLGNEEQLPKGLEVQPEGEPNGGSRPGVRIYDLAQRIGLARLVTDLVTLGYQIVEAKVVEHTGDRGTVYKVRFVFQNDAKQAPNPVHIAALETMTRHVYDVVVFRNFLPEGQEGLCVHCVGLAQITDADGQPILVYAKTPGGKPRKEAPKVPMAPNDELVIHSGTIAYSKMALAASA